MSEAIDLDHVALAFNNAFDGLDRYRGDLGGAFIGGAVDPGFYWGQVRYANGMCIELLEPKDVELDDFLQRFITRNGEGPHHFTFKVPDIHEMLDRVRSAGLEPARVNLESPVWKEVFLHPKQAQGIVVQLAQALGDGDMFGEDRLPPAREPGPVSLHRIVYLVSDLDAAVSLFEALLDGNRVPDGADDDAVELTWPGGGRIRLHRPRTESETEWLSGRSGRLNYLEFSAPDPSSIRHARAAQNGGFEIDPADNYGTRVRLVAA